MCTQGAALRQLHKQGSLMYPHSKHPHVLGVLGVSTWRLGICQAPGEEIAVLSGPEAALHWAQLSFMASGCLCVRCCVPSSAQWECSAAAELRCLGKIPSTCRQQGSIPEEKHQIIYKGPNGHWPHVVWGFCWWEMCCVSIWTVHVLRNGKEKVCVRLVELEMTGIKNTWAKKNVIYLTSVWLPAVVVF